MPLSRIVANWCHQWCWSVPGIVITPKITPRMTANWWSWIERLGTWNWGSTRERYSLVAWSMSSHMALMVATSGYHRGSLTSNGPGNQNGERKHMRRAYEHMRWKRSTMAPVISHSRRCLLSSTHHQWHPSPDHFQRFTVKLFPCKSFRGDLSVRFSTSRSYEVHIVNGSHSVRGYCSCWITGLKNWDPVESFEEQCLLAEMTPRAGSNRSN